MTDIKRISFGFPLNSTIETTIDKIDEIKTKDFSGKNIHLKIHLDKMLDKKFKREELQQSILNSTNAANLKLDFIYENESSERSKDIVEKTNIIDKFKAYCELNNIKYNEQTVDKIVKIQNLMLEQDIIPHESFTLEYASVRGAIGIMDKAGLEEMSVDFTNDYNPGIIGICGAFGSGKTSFLENLTPYPSMLTRTGSLKDHFCLKDSHRILVYKTDSGKKYRISMFIDGRAKNVNNRYLVEVKIGDKSWEPIKSIDGSTETYTDWVNKTFGSKNLFLRTAFYTTSTIKNIPDLSQATKTEKIELFSVLAGLDYLSLVSKKAKEEKDDAMKQMNKIKDQLEGFDDLDKKKTENEEAIKNCTKSISEYEGLIKIDTEELNEYKERQKMFIAATASYDIYRKEFSEKEAEKTSTEKLLHISNNNIEELKQRLEDIGVYKQQISWYEEHIEKRKILKTEVNDLRDRMNSMQATLELKEKDIKEKENSLNEIVTGIKLKNNVVDNLKKSIPQDDGLCPFCKKPLDEHRQEEVKKERENIEKEILGYNKELNDLNDKKTECEQWLKEHSLQSFKAELTSINNSIIEKDNDINEIDVYMDTIDINEAKSVVNDTEKFLKEEEVKKDDLTKKIESLSKRLDELNKLMSEIPEDFSDKISRLERGILDSQQNISDMKAEINVARKNLDTISNSEKIIENIKSQIKSYEKDIKDYEIIQASFGNTGIPIIELSTAAPEISDIANNILSESFDNRFKIEFDTQRDTKDNKRIDDFVITVFDSRSGRTKRLDWISGGEGLLIKQALYYAFSVIRARRTGLNFKTRFLDESDGALDGDTRIEYLKMIKSAHEQCNAVQTLLITHSIEVKEVLEQKIDF